MDNITPIVTPLRTLSHATRDHSELM